MYTYTACTRRCGVCFVRTGAWSLFVLASLAAAPECVCSFHWLLSTPPNPWEFVDQQLLKKLLGVGVCNSAKTECNGCNRAHVFMWYLWCVLFAMAFGSGEGRRGQKWSKASGDIIRKANRQWRGWSLATLQNTEGVVLERRFMIANCNTSAFLLFSPRALSSAWHLLLK